MVGKVIVEKDMHKRKVGLEYVLIKDAFELVTSYISYMIGRLCM